jgi:hypothetical protein
VLGQKELRWGLHPPSFSSGESWKATWINYKLGVKLNMLAKPVSAVSAVIRAISGVLNSDWHRTGENYP